MPKFKTTIRLGAAHNEVLSVSPAGEKIVVPLDKATVHDRHALAGTLCKLHEVTGKPASRRTPQAQRTPRVRIEDLARAMTACVEAFWRNPGTPLLIRGGSIVEG